MCHNVSLNATFLTTPLRSVHLFLLSDHSAATPVGKKAVTHYRNITVLNHDLNCYYDIPQCTVKSSIATDCTNLDVSVLRWDTVSQVSLLTTQPTTLDTIFTHMPHIPRPFAACHPLNIDLLYDSTISITSFHSATGDLLHLILAHISCH